MNSDSLLKKRNQILKSVNRLVIKIGSGVITTSDRTGLLPDSIRSVVRQTVKLINEGKKVILVSSGAIAAGSRYLGLKSQPVSIPQKQAAAAVGQTKLIGQYESFFAREGIHTAQILLTHSELSNRTQFLNAQNTIFSLLQYGIVPIINENDSIAVDEIKFGDNDTLSAMVSSLTDSELLILLSDVEGLWTADPKKHPEAEFVSFVESITPEIERMAGPSSSGFSVGGMRTKIEAAKKASAAGIPMGIVSGHRDDSILQFMKGEKIGTFFFPKADRLSSRKHWIAHTLKPKGKIVVDDGARDALVNKGKSLLASGLVSVSGNFDLGEAVICEDVRRVEFARGLIKYNSADLRKIKGVKTGEIQKILGYKYSDEIIHRNDLIITAHDS
jgi:glutamate 5-kinase